jgi:hypothetical protein
MIWSWFPAPSASWEALSGFMAQQHVPPWWNERLEPGWGWVGVEEPWGTRLTCWYFYWGHLSSFIFRAFLFSLGNFLPPFLRAMVWWSWFQILMEILDCSDEWMLGEG